MDPRPEEPDDFEGRPRPGKAQEGTWALVIKALLALGEGWARRLLATGGLVVGACFLTVAWWEARPILDLLERNLSAGEEALASQHELYWTIVPGQDRHAQPSAPGSPQGPRLRLELVLGFEASDGSQNRLRLLGPERGMWAMAHYFLRPLQHLGESAVLTMPVELRIAPSYREDLMGTPVIYGPHPQGTTLLEAVERDIDLPLELLAFTWWLSEPRQVPISYRPKAPERGWASNLTSLRGARVLESAIGMGMMALIALVSLSFSLRFLFRDPPEWLLASGLAAIFLTVPWWSPQLGRILPWLGDADESAIESLLGALAPDPTPDRISMAPGDEDLEFEVIRWDLSRSRGAELLDFLRLERGERRFESAEAAYGAILDDITQRIVSAPSNELARFFQQLTGLLREGEYPLQEALLEGADRVAADPGRPEELRTLAARALASSVQRLDYSYYEFASAERLARLRPFRQHPDPEIAERVRKEIDWLQEHGHRGY